MNRFFYAKLALTNIKKNRKTYLPYILACIGTIMMFYIILSLSQNSALGQMSGGDVLAIILLLGSGIVGFFAVLFLFYTNSFLVKRRKKEFGLYYILGMEKRHISRIMFWETLYTAGVSLALGIGIGIVFGKLVFLGLLKMLRLNVIIGMEFCVPAMGVSAAVFGVIFLLTFLNSVRQVYMVRPIELLKGGQSGEKEPKTKWLMTAAGIVTLIAGYGMAVGTRKASDSIFAFFGAAILVIIATFCLFTAGSIVLLKLLRKKKSYYYQTRHFISVSGMLYRMKQNAASLASICVMSTGVILLLSSTTSLYVGMEASLLKRFPYEYEVRISGEQEALTEAGNALETFVETKGEAIYDLQGHTEFQFSAGQTKDRLVFGFEKIHETEKAEPLELKVVRCVPLEDYNRMKGTKETLEKGEALFYTTQGSYESDVISFDDYTLKLKKTDDAGKFLGGEETVYTAGVYGLIVPDVQTVQEIAQIVTGYYEEEFAPSVKRIYTFDTKEKEEQILEWKEELEIWAEEAMPAGVGMYTECRTRERGAFYALYGGIFFIGIFLGLLFIMATILVIYYKQISEGYEDRERFIIMQKIGMDQEEVRKAIHGQVLQVFFLPLITAGIHSCFAFPIMQIILKEGFGLTDTRLFVTCMGAMFLIFGAFYTAVYLITAREYYKIVSWEKN